MEPKRVKGLEGAGHQHPNRDQDSQASGHQDAMHLHTISAHFTQQTPAWSTAAGVVTLSTAHVVPKKCLLREHELTCTGTTLTNQMFFGNLGRYAHNKGRLCHQNMCSSTLCMIEASYPNNHTVLSCFTLFHNFSRHRTRQPTVPRICTGHETHMHLEVLQNLSLHCRGPPLHAMRSFLTLLFSTEEARTSISFSTQGTCKLPSQNSKGKKNQLTSGRHCQKATHLVANFCNTGITKSRT